MFVLAQSGHFALHADMSAPEPTSPSRPRYFSAGNIGDTLLPAFKAVMSSPNTYFADMPREDGYRDSLMLLCIYLGIPAVVAGMATGVIGIVVILPLSLLFGVIGTWMWAAYLGWAARRFCGSSLSNAAAFRICAYASAPLVFSWIPIIGLLAWLSNLFLNWQGLVSHGRIGAGAALLIILAAFFLLALSLAVLVALLFYVTDHYGVQFPAPWVSHATWF